VRALTAAAVGFVLGWAAAFVPCLVGTKFTGPRVRKLIREYAPSGISPDKLKRMWAEEDSRFDVLPTDDELTYTEQEADRNAAFNRTEPECCRARSTYEYLCSQPAGHPGPHLAEGIWGELLDSWSA
jgi:hypothetical protein